jgi:hypothetical protein
MPRHPSLLLLVNSIRRWIFAWPTLPHFRSMMRARIWRSPSCHFTTSTRCPPPCDKSHAYLNRAASCALRSCTQSIRPAASKRPPPMHPSSSREITLARSLMRTWSSEMGCQSPSIASIDLSKAIFWRLRRQACSSKLSESRGFQIVLSTRIVVAVGSGCPYSCTCAPAADHHPPLVGNGWSAMCSSSTLATKRPGFLTWRRPAGAARSTSPRPRPAVHLRGAAEPLPGAGHVRGRPTTSCWTKGSSHMESGMTTSRWPCSTASMRRFSATKRDCCGSSLCTIAADGSFCLDSFRGRGSLARI